jgi:hypothetical protein
MSLLKLWGFGVAMPDVVRSVLSGIKTIDDVIVAFSNEQHCRGSLEDMIWSKDRICSACGYKHSIKIAGRDRGRRRAWQGSINVAIATAGFSLP